jgi:ABC-type multidrug transport system fused ATPase/permease subunit
MTSEKNKHMSKKFRWHIIIVLIALLVGFLLVVFTDVFQTPQVGSMAQLVWSLGVLVLFIAVTIMLLRTLTMFKAFAENSDKLDKISEMLEKNRLVLTEIKQSGRLSETAKAIAFREADRQSLREAVFDKLQQQDFKTAYEIIDEIAHSTMYHELAEQLRADADRYRDATDQERISQVIAMIEKLFENYDWAKASTQIERLIRAYPKSDKAKEMRQKLVDKKQERKKILLTAWDDAIQRQDTDRSLEILRELDLYLSPNEGLALQEAARDVFRTKLHNMGVQFAMAVSEKKWKKALEAGQQIIRYFPNSRMAAEIHQKWEVLKQRAVEK